MKPINVLSLFDGISCGQLALKQLRVPIKVYYASEINIHAMKISHRHFPDTKYLGYVESVKAVYLPKIDLVLAGSPCQGFSNAGRGLNFNDPRSKLFFEFIRILDECRKKNPGVLFLLENVRMKQEWCDIITEHVKVDPVLINSELVSAQTRSRFYWANFPISQPKDRNIKVMDILKDPYTLEEVGPKATDRTWKHNFNGALSVLNLDGKAGCVMTQSGGSYPIIPVGFKKYRHMDINELERLQTLPDDYTKGIPLAERVNAIGNGWTIEVIKHILKFILR